MPVKLILVDSSVWIDYFRASDDHALSRLIKEDLVCTNQLIINELIPSLLKNGRNDIVESLESLSNIPLQIDWEIIRKYQLENLKRGINKVRIPDLIILQQVIFENLALTSLDKHFLHMQSYLDFEVYSA
ncbi:MAG: PIN domain-containing protein [Bacteroidota bacterium]